MKFDYHKWLNSAVSFFGKFRYIIISSTIVLVLIFAVFRINQHSNVEINQQRFDEEVLTVKRIEFDQDVIQQVLDLRDLNVDIESIFPSSRNNPFD